MADKPTKADAKAAASKLTASAVRKALAGDTDGARAAAEKAKLANRIITASGADDATE